MAVMYRKGIVDNKITQLKSTIIIEMIDYYSIGDLQSNIYISATEPKKQQVTSTSDQVQLVHHDLRHRSQR